MKIIKLVQFFILLLSIPNSLEAQDKGQPKKTPKWLNIECQDTIAWLNLSIDSLHKENLVLNTKISDFEKERNQLKKDSSTLRQENNNLKEERDKLKKNLADEIATSQIHRFINLKDTSIFNSKFLKLDIKEIHPSWKNYYMLIEAIHDLRGLIMMNNTSNNGDVIAHVKKIKKNLEDARQKIKDINAYVEYDFLSEPQKQYFRQLIDRYNELNREVNSNEN